MNKEYHGRNVALAGMREHAEPNKQGEAVWKYCERRIVRIHASKNKRIETLKAHVLRVEKVCAQKNAYIDKLNQRIGRRDQTINRQALSVTRLQQDNEVLAARVGRRDQTVRNKAECIETQRDEIVALHEQIEELKKQNGDLQNDVTVMNERYEAIEMEMAEVLQRAD
jgi:predicted  nucleic acid-binding Zn-ribbon protein